MTSSFTPLATRAAYERAGLKTLLLDSPATIAASEAQIRMLAAAVNAPGRGEAMVARIEAALAAASPLTLPRRQPGSSSGAPQRQRCPGLRQRNVKRATTLLFISGALANGPGNLLDELMMRAGLANAGTGYGLAYTGPVALETIAANPPALILTPGPSRSAELRKKVLARMQAPTRSAIFARSLVNCGGPTIVTAIMRLAELRRGQP